jgi:hypothetical protein
MTTDLQTRLTALLSSESAAEDVRAYFAEPPAPTFTGRHFERFGGGGDRAETADRFTADDLLAVEALSVTVPIEVSYAILHGVLGEDLAQLVSKIPAHIAIGAPQAAEHLADGAPADQAWRLLTRQTDVGWVTAGKLLARKRPRLIPVWDQVVRCALGAPEHAWSTLNEAMASPEVREGIADLRPQAPTDSSDLRLVDVVVWMGHREEHGPACP